MEVVVLQSGKEDKVLTEITTIIEKVLGELQVKVKYIKLNQIPYYEGNREPIVEEVLESIENSCGVIMTSRVELLSVSGSLCAFFEHCSQYQDEELFQKPLFSIAASSWRGEREAAEYMLHAWDVLGGIEFGKLGIYTPNYHLDKENITAHIEKMTEDFYRSIKQVRLKVKSSDQSFLLQNKDKEFAPIFERTLAKQAPNYKDVQSVRQSQEQDIEYIASIFKKQLQENEPVQLEVEPNTAIYSRPTPVQANTPEPNIKTPQHMLRSFPHYFQAQYAADFQAVVQYHLLDDEPFDGHIIIQGGSCTFGDGIYKGAEIELTAPSEVFKDIFTKKLTSQKAFMLGQLKVRGNFMLLPKIDQMFKKM